jgi:hypothetical protein
LIDVQRGDYLGEDDIVRLEDDFGRAGSAVGERRVPMALTVRWISDEPIVAAGAMPGYGPIFNAG